MASRWHSCNVLHSGMDSRVLWHFDARKGNFVLNKEYKTAGTESLPGNIVNKTWNSIWQPKLNVAWLPTESVFFRVVHLPKATPDETVSMIELQLERLSPIPVTQMVWTIQLLPQELEGLQTLIVVFVERKAVEEFLGKIESNGFLADRLELPALDQILATPVNEVGAWIYPGVAGGPGTALVAWWSAGVLQNITFISLPMTGDVAAGLKEQLSHAAWAGELEGWLTSAPAWHLVADEDTARLWEPPLRQGLNEPVTVSAPLSVAELAALTARRASQPATKTNLLPPEHLKRYQQQFVDRLWMRGLAAVGLIYVACVLIYFAVVGVVAYQTDAAETKVTNLSGTYTNAIQLKAKLNVLQERQELKYAALDCWNAVADGLPESVALDGFNFNDGSKLSLNGTVPKDEVGKVLDFNAALKKVAVKGQPLFSVKGGQDVNSRLSGANVTWNFGLELNRVVDQ